MNASLNAFPRRRRPAGYSGTGTVVLGHAPADLFSAYGLAVLGSALVVLGFISTSELASIARIDGAILLLLGLAGVVFYRGSSIKADGVGIWHESVLGRKRGIAWSDATCIELQRSLEVWGPSGRRILLDPRRPGLPALSALILLRVARERITPLAYRELTAAQEVPALQKMVEQFSHRARG